MKKFFVIVSIFVLSLPLFAIPKYDGKFINGNIPEDLYNPNKAIQYINNSGQNIYALTVLENKDNYRPYELYFSNYSLVSKVEILISISFLDETELDDFSSNYINSVNLEDIFISVRNLFINKSKKPNIVTPDIKSKNRDSLKSVVYEALYCDIKD